jgi:hypothetical protein
MKPAPKNAVTPGTSFLSMLSGRLAKETFDP